MADFRKIECPVCSDTGWVRVETDKGFVARRCACVLAKRDAAVLDRTRIPARYRDCTLDNFAPKNDSLKDALKISKKFIAKFPEADVGLLFIGPCGVGKTHLASAILSEIVRTKGSSGLFYDFRDLIRDIQNTFSPDSDLSESDILTPVFECGLLALDELGAKRSSTWVEETIFYIINRRYNERKLTIFTSNYPDTSDDEDDRVPMFKKSAAFGGPKKTDETLVDRIGIRLRSRIYEMCKVVDITGEDFRKTIKQASYRF
ncbi:MAG: ATP-binding protein [Candidatus Aminicenantes bacterium]|nr:ATP-binding protein [Candidatus Aminicenantes bacterium]